MKLAIPLRHRTELRDIFIKSVRPLAKYLRAKQYVNVCRCSVFPWKIVKSPLDNAKIGENKMPRVAAMLVTLVQSNNTRNKFLINYDPGLFILSFRSASVETRLFRKIKGIRFETVRMRLKCKKQIPYRADKPFVLPEMIIS